MTGGLLRKARSAGGTDGLAGGLEQLSGAVDRLSRLTNQVLDVSQIAAGKLVLNREEFDLAELVREVAARFQDG
ncbi:MAG TPA: histidine kinase, partial [Thermoanaerobaculia bacterium]|nr:histidine kinase [Thermoanaerobaculia bacterium]